MAIRTFTEHTLFFASHKATLENVFFAVNTYRHNSLCSKQNKFLYNLAKKELDTNYL